MKFPFYIVHEDYSIQGLNCTLEEAREAAEWAVVIDAENGTELSPDGSDDCEIKEYIAPVDGEDSSELPADLIAKD